MCENLRKVRQCHQRRRQWGKKGPGWYWKMVAGRDQDRQKNQEKVKKKRGVVKSCVVVVDNREICPHGRQHLWTHKFFCLPGTVLCIPSSHEDIIQKHKK